MAKKTRSAGRAAREKLIARAQEARNARDRVPADWREKLKSKAKAQSEERHEHGGMPTHEVGILLLTTSDDITHRFFIAYENGLPLDVFDTELEATRFCVGRLLKFFRGNELPLTDPFEFRTVRRRDADEGAADEDAPRG